MSSEDTVGFALIVKNASSTLDVCLRSIDGLWDDLVVVDTGSTDNTKEIAAKYGARIFDFKWCDDFSAARNFSFDQLTTKWLFWVDSDDLLIGREYFDEMLSKCIEKNLDGVILEYIYSLEPTGQQILEQLEPTILSRHIHSEDVISKLKPHCNTTQFRERLVRNLPNWRWIYPVHEALPVPGYKLGKYDKVKILHRRHKTGVPARNRRNLDILDRVPWNKRDERVWFYFGLEYAAHHMISEAIDAFQRYLPLSTVPDEKYLAYHYLADLYRASDNYEKAIEHDLMAVGMRPTWRDGYMGLLSSYAKKGKWELALYYGAMTKKAEVPDTPFAFNPVHEEVGWVPDYINALLNTGALEEALEECRRAIKILPNDPQYFKLIDDISIALNTRAGSDVIADVLEFFLRHDDGDTAALIASRIPREIRGHDKVKPYIQMINMACSLAASGRIPGEEVKIAAGTQIIQNESISVYDTRMRILVDRLSFHPRVRTALIVGGPSVSEQVLSGIGLKAYRTDSVYDIQKNKYDCVILWNCLERVQRPDRLLAYAKQAVLPSGVLFVIVANGPSKKGLAPPQLGQIRMRAFNIDSIRQLIETTRFPIYTEVWAAEAGDMIFEVPLPLNNAPPADIAIVCPVSPEPWGPWSLGKGIGGSEEAVVRLSRAFTKRGHVVTVYGSGWSGRDLVGDYLGNEHGIVEYKPLKDYTSSKVLLGWRYPEIFYNQFRPFESGWKALWLHDSIPTERVAMASQVVDKIWCISEYHASLYKGIPKIYSGRNGIDSFELPEIGSIERNPFKTVYVSTPFRGLDLLLDVWPQIKSRVPEAELHAYYGWESADRMGATSTPEGKAFKEKVMRQVEELGVYWHGRIGQHELYKEMMSAGVWSYFSRWNEEHCISSLISQACGAWPVVTPLGALPQTTVWGQKVQPQDFVDAVVSAMYTEHGRDQMMKWGRGYHTSWDEVSALWERLWLGYEA